MKPKKKHFEISHLLKKEDELTNDEILLIKSSILTNTLSLMMIKYVSQNPN